MRVRTLRILLRNLRRSVTMTRRRFRRVLLILMRLIRPFGNWIIFLLSVMPLVRARSRFRRSLLRVLPFWHCCRVAASICSRSLRRLTCVILRLLVVVSLLARSGLLRIALCVVVLALTLKRVARRRVRRLVRCLRKLSWKTLLSLAPLLSPQGARWRL